MLLLGAGMSAPFGIPTMGPFTTRFEKEIEKCHDEKQIYIKIKKSAQNAGLNFDLELLMAVINDLRNPKMRLTIPTIKFLIEQESLSVNEITPKIISEKFGEISEKLDYHIKDFIREVCISPSNNEQIQEVFDLIYGPLFRVLGRHRLSTPPQDISHIFTTNWDGCLRHWMDYRHLNYRDGTIQDDQSRQVFTPESAWKPKSNSFDIIPLHGSLSLTKEIIRRKTGDYEEIVKKDELLGTFNPFIILPLEAVGYEDMARYPYLDLINILRDKLNEENCVFVIGFSFRDPTICSVFEEVLRNKERHHEWVPLEGDVGERMKSLVKERPYFKLFLLDSDPEQVLKNIKKQGFHNLFRACLPIKIDLPMANYGISHIKKFMKEIITKIGVVMLKLELCNGTSLKQTYREIEEDFDIVMPKNDLGEYDLGEL